MKFSVTTVTLPMMDLRETAQFVAGLGCDGAEWRCRHLPADMQDKPYSPWGNVKNDLSPDNLMVRGEELVAVSQEFGLEIVALATNMWSSELDEVRKVAEACEKWGIPAFRLGGPRKYDYQENYRRFQDDARRAYAEAIKITSSHGVKVLLEIHRGTVACSPSQAHVLVKEFDPQHIGVIYDIANQAFGEGYEPPSMGLDLLGEYVQHVHAGGGRPTPKEERGALGEQQWDWGQCDLADSVLDVPKFVKELTKRGYDRYLSLEDFRKEDPAEKFGRNLAFLKAAVAAA